MFIRFHSDAFEDITYFADVANQLIKLMGHSGSVPGAIKAEEVAAALVQLQIKLGKNSNPPLPAPSQDEHEPDIALARRAIPLIYLLQAAEKKRCDVLWDATKSP